jgi:hypothetical protein
VRALSTKSDRMIARALSWQGDAANIEVSIEQLLEPELLAQIGADNPNGGRTLPFRVMRICDALADYAVRLERAEHHLKLTNMLLTCECGEFYERVCHACAPTVTTTG